MSYFGNTLYPTNPPNQQAVVSITGTTTLGVGAATYEKQFIISGAGAYTITLPAIDGTNFPSKSFSIFNNSAATCTVNSAGSDTMLLLGSSFSSISILPGERFLVQNMVTNWVIALESASRTTTAPQFDNTIRAASTAFVQRALGNFQSYIPISSNTTLTASQSGSFVEIVGGFVSGTVTLPAPTTQLLTFTIYCGTSATALNLTTPSGSISSGNNGFTNFPLTPGSSCQVVSDGVNWNVISGQGTGALSASGYQRFPSGMIMQWGTLTTSGSGDVTVNYPIAFPTAVYNVTITPSLSGGIGGFAGTNTLGLSSFTANGWSSSSTRVVVAADWFAIGK